MTAISETLAIAIQHHQAGRLRAAEQLYRQILQAEPHQADALHLLGMIAYQVGKLDDAVACYRRTLELEPDFAEAHNNLGVAFKGQGKPGDAVACYRRALELKPNYAEAYNNLGAACKEQGKLDEAVACYRRALQLNPDFAEAHNNLGNALKNQGKRAEAIACYCQALQRKPDYAEAHCNLGVACKEEGNLAEAVACYRRALERNPHYAAAHNNLGVVFKEQGKPDEAIACYRRALALKPDDAEAHNNLGNALRDQGKLAEAVACYRRALERKPDLAEVHSNLGVALKDQGKLEDAIASYCRALERKPDYAEAHNNLGVALRDQGKLDDAVACYRRALEREPGYAEAHGNLGNALRDQGRLDDAVASCRRALELKPNLAAAHNNLANALRDQGKLDDAVVCYCRALELEPDYPEALNNLGNAWKDQGKPDEAIACCRRALALEPDFAEAHNNLGNAFRDQGKLDEAVACYRRTVQLKPDDAAAHSNLVYTQIFRPGCDAQTLHEEHRQWNQRHAAPLARFIQPHPGDCSPDRRLRVGYVSPDFRDHCQAFFTVPLFSAHRHADFEIVCYADVVRPDRVTERLCSYADNWRNITGLGHEQVAQRIRQDRIDILVDLTMHMARNRLLVFARKPAPVQVCWLAYPGTTGLSTIDYRLTDSYLDPPEFGDRGSAEEPIRLPDSFWCYDPLQSEPAVNALPAAERGYITFGCLNNFCKVNPPVLKTSAQVLKAVDRSRLTLLAHEGMHRRQAQDLLAAEGVARDRVTFVAQGSRQQYLRYYHGIDIGLDTVPYNGHTTSLDSFWMGVPVVTLVGPTVVGRAGLCQLMNLGLPELIASSPEQYVRVAAELARDLPRLGNLRATLRERLQGSPLMDAPRFARNVETAYREMWRRWCVK